MELRKATAPLLSAVVLLAGCAAGGEGAAAGGTTTTVQALKAAVDAGTAPDLTAVSEQRSVTAGETVRTDPSGLAELRFPDGSLARLAKTESVLLTELSAASVQRTRQKLTIGQTWHIVAELTAGGAAYEVETPVGVAAVRGTTFALVCTAGPQCVLTVLDGTVTFTPVGKPAVTVGAYMRLTVGETGGLSGPRGVSAATLRADPWIAPNVERDELEELYERAPAAATFARYEGRLRMQTPDGTEVSVNLVTLDCSAACYLMANGPFERGRRVPVTREGGGRFAFNDPPSGQPCAKYGPGYIGTAVLSGDAMTMELTAPGSVTSCEGGRLLGTQAYRYSFTGTLIDGEPILD